MTTVIDSLVLELNIDPSQLSQTARAAIDVLGKFENEAMRVGTSIESEGKRITNFFDGLKKEALGLTATIFGGEALKQFVTEMTNMDAATSRFSKTLGISANDLGVWDNAAQQVGGTAASIRGTLGAINMDMNRFMLGHPSSLIGPLTPFQISLFDTNHQLKTATQLMLDLAGASEKMDKRRAAAYLSDIPGMNQDTINLLLEGRSAVVGRLSKAQESVRGTDESGELAKKYQENMALLSGSLTSLNRVILTYLAPPLTTIAEYLTKILNLFGSQKETPEQVAKHAESNKTMSKLLGDPGNVHRFIGGLFGEDPKVTEARIKDWYGEPDKPAQATPKRKRERRASVYEPESIEERNLDNFFGYGYRGVGAVGAEAAMAGKSTSSVQRGDLIGALNPFGAGAASGTPWGSSGAIGAKAGAKAQVMKWPTPGNTNTTSNETNIHSIIVHTQAENAAGIANDIGPAIKRSGFASQANITGSQ